MVMHFLEKHEGTKQEVLVRTFKETRSALERQAWEAIMIDRTARNPEQCLNLKNEWSWSQRPALTSGGKNGRKNQGDERQKEEEEEESKNSKRRRHPYAQEKMKEESKEEQEPRSKKKRNYEEGPEEKKTEELSSSTVQTGANTPVTQKIKRYEQKIERKSKEERDNKIQPTLRSFMDLRGGLVGPQRLPRPTGNQHQGGRDLEAGNNVEFGVTRKEKDNNCPDNRVLEGGEDGRGGKDDKKTENSTTRPRRKGGGNSNKDSREEGSRRYGTQGKKRERE